MQRLNVLNLSITQPDDWHVHLRDGETLKNTVNGSAKHFARILVMPNLQPPITSTAGALSYRSNILKELNKNSQLNPYMSIYLTTDVSPDEIYKIKAEEFILSAKLYPKGATTNSDAGASNLKDLYPHFAALEDINAVLQIHGEVTNADIFDREKIFIKESLIPIIKNFPNLRIVLEHISTKEACEFINDASQNIAATITPQHLLYNRNHLLAGGIKPHFYCLPILKRERDQRSLLNAALSGNKKFFAGTDSAPHTKSQKESACGCAGVYSAPFAVSLYAEAFSNNGAIEKLNNFMGKFGAEFYQLPQNTSKIELIKKPIQIPESMPLGNDIVIPLAARQTLQWSVGL